MLQAGDSARRNARAVLQTFGGNARQRGPANSVARALPGLTRHAEHRALAGPGIADNDAETALAGHVLERRALLPRQNQTTVDSAIQRRLPAALSDVAPPALSHHLRRTLQPLLGLDHLARGEPFLAAPVLAERNQIGRAAHRAHHLVELIPPVTVAVNEAREITGGEGRLLVRDRIERDGRAGNDPRTIALGNGAVLFDPFRLKPAPLHARGGGPDLVLWLKIDALRFQAAMIDARINIELGEAFIDVLGPALAPLLDQLGAVPVAHLRAEAVGIDLAHGEHHVRVRLGESIGADVPMDIEIGDHAAIDKLAFDELARQPDAFCLIELARDCKFDLARELRVLALL